MQGKRTDDLHAPSPHDDPDRDHAVRGAGFSFRGNGAETTEALQMSLDMAKLGGMKDLVPASEIISTQFKPVPTKP